MDQSLEKNDIQGLVTHLLVLLSTQPPRNFLDRWLEKMAALARENKEEEKFSAWLAVQSAEAKPETFREAFAQRLNRMKADALYKKEKWTAAEKAEAIKHYADSVKAKSDKGKIAKGLEALFDACLAKTEGAKPEDLLAELKALFPAGSDEAKRTEPAFLELGNRRSLHKDWLFLGPFADVNAGAWEKVAPANGKLHPNFSAQFGELSWRRPFKPEVFGPVDLVAALKPGENVFAYAAAEIEAEKELDARLLLGSDDGITAWLDGKEIHRHPGARPLTVDEDNVAIRLSAGVHSLVLRIDNGMGGWGFSARLGDAQGKSPLPGVKVRCPAQPEAAKP